VSRHLESLGHEVIVADANYAPMYANRSRRTKTDKRDARTLMDACATNAYRPAHRLSEPRYVALAKALVRRDGLRVPTSSSAWVPTRIAELDLSPALITELAPFFAVYAVDPPLNEQIAAADRRSATVAASDPIVARLATAPGVGPVTASAFAAAIDDITRFHSAHELEAYLGVVPSERSSGEKRQLGHITKAGNGRMRWCKVEAACQILRSKSAGAAVGRGALRDVAGRRPVRRAAASATGDRGTATREISRAREFESRLGKYGATRHAVPAACLRCRWDRSSVGRLPTSTQPNDCGNPVSTSAALHGRAKSARPSVRCATKRPAETPRLARA